MGGGGRQKRRGKEGTEGWTEDGWTDRGRKAVFSEKSVLLCSLITSESEVLVLLGPTNVNTGKSSWKTCHWPVYPRASMARTAGADTEVLKECNEDLVWLLGLLPVSALICSCLWTKLRVIQNSDL